MRLLYVGVGLKEGVCLLCGYAWGIGKYLSRSKRRRCEVHRRRKLDTVSKKSER